MRRLFLPSIPTVHIIRSVADITDSLQAFIAYARFEIDRFIRLKGGSLEKEGHLKSFVESGSGAWPEPAIPPTLK